MLHTFLKGLAPVAALAATFAVGACDADVTINGGKGVPLAELDTAGKSPTELVLAGPDSVVVAEGSELKIEVSGDPAAVAALRFTLDGESLGVMRRKGDETKGTAKVSITLPSLEKIVLAGSGTVDAPALSGDAEITVAGSGTARTASVDANDLEVTIAGSGIYEASGTVERLDLTVAGSGRADMAGLSAEKAEVTIAGSGTAAFASDGTVEANIMGSGMVTVTGEAKCTISAMGSGTLVCKNGGAASASPADRGKGKEGPPRGPAPPLPPATPEAPSPAE